jgi:uncharacterized integral membrane protein
MAPQPGAAATEPAVPRTRAGSAWTALAVGMVVLLVFVVFIVQNIHGVKVSFLFFHWKLPLAIDLLLAAVLGGLVVFLLGSVRMLQLRRAAQRNAGTRR